MATWPKSPPPGWGKMFWLQIYPFQAISSNFGFCGSKAPLPQDEGFFFDFRSIHFRQFWATLVFVAEKPPQPPPPRRMRIFFEFRYIHFRQFWATLVFVAEKSPQTVTSSVSCWPSGVNYSIPVISVRASEGATHTSFEVSEQASFKGYFISLVVICVK